MLLALRVLLKEHHATWQSPSGVPACPPTSQRNPVSGDASPPRPFLHPPRAPSVNGNAQQGFIWLPHVTIQHEPIGIITLTSVMQHSTGRPDHARAFEWRSRTLITAPPPSTLPPPLPPTCWPPSGGGPPPGPPKKISKAPFPPPPSRPSKKGLRPYAEAHHGSVINPGDGNLNS